MSVYITDVEKGSLAERHGIVPGSTLIKINGHDITDVLDYRFYMVDSSLRILYTNPEGRFCLIKIENKDDYEDLGMVFETYLMDKQRRCKNACIFCFIDQLPKGMRESLYFKDDDSRLSFFYGNYITLTNLTQHDVDRIIEMHISPINVSVHTMNPELRVKMMKNKNAGTSLKYLRQLAKAGIGLNTQLVLCPGINDGKELEYSLSELQKLGDSIQSIAAVPVGLSDHREGLYPLKMYDRDTARETIKIIEKYAESFKAKTGKRLCYAADEFYIKAELPFPDEDYYEGYPQLENGIGMCRLLEREVSGALDDALENGELLEAIKLNGPKKRVLSMATGVAVYPLIQELACKVENIYNEKAGKKLLEIHVHKVVNDFFGKNITVSGLLTGTDLLNQLKDKELGQVLLLPDSMFKTTYPQDDSNDNVLLDDVTMEELSEKLSVPICPVESDGYKLVETLLEVGRWQDQ